MGVQVGPRLRNGNSRRPLGRVPASPDPVLWTCGRTPVSCLAVPVSDLRLPHGEDVRCVAVMCGWPPGYLTRQLRGLVPLDVITDGER